MRRLLPILASATLLLTGCSSRERANPFDPLNPQTSGRPSQGRALVPLRDPALSDSLQFENV